jgi:hypothetical protein
VSRQKSRVRLHDQAVEDRENQALADQVDEDDEQQRNLGGGTSTTARRRIRRRPSVRNRTRRVQRRPKRPHLPPGIQFFEVSSCHIMRRRLSALLIYRPVFISWLARLGTSVLRAKT